MYTCKATEMPRALLLRHGESVSNARPEMLALPEEVGDRLSAKGRDQAQAAAGALAEFGITRLLSSPLRRARETATVVGEMLDLPVEAVPHVRELCEKADREGLVPGDRLLRDGVAQMAAHADDPDHAAGTESFNHFVGRVVRLQTELESGPQQAQTLIVTHGIFIRFFFLRALLGETFGPGMTSTLWNLRSRNCGLSVFEHGRRRSATGTEAPGWTCVTWMARPWDPP